MVNQQDEVIRLRKLKLMKTEAIAEMAEESDNVNLCPEERDLGNLEGLVGGMGQGNPFSSLKKTGVEEVIELEEEYDDDQIP